MEDGVVVRISGQDRGKVLVRDARVAGAGEVEGGTREDGECQCQRQVDEVRRGEQRESGGNEERVGPREKEGEEYLGLCQLSWGWRAAKGQKRGGGLTGSSPLTSTTG